MKIVSIRHYGYSFVSNENAVLLVTGITHHIVLMKH
jgi:hypothetical protein